jgi:hypothetical protein
MESKPREFNRLGDDSCYIAQKDAGNAKRLKYMTTNVTDDSQFVTEGKVNFMGVPATMSAAEFSPEIDTTMKFSALTNCKGREEPYSFPLAGPSFTSSGPHVEAAGIYSRERGACNLKPTEFQERVYVPFVTSEVPDPLRSVYHFGPQSGISTRAENRIKIETGSGSTLKKGGVGQPVSCEYVHKGRYDCN